MGEGGGKWGKGGGKWGLGTPCPPPQQWHIETLVSVGSAFDMSGFEPTKTELPLGMCYLVDTVLMIGKLLSPDGLITVCKLK